MTRCSSLRIGGAKIARALRAYALIDGHVVALHHPDQLVGDSSTPVWVMHSGDRAPTADMFHATELINNPGLVSEFAFYDTVSPSELRGRGARAAAPSLADAIGAKQYSRAAAMLVSAGDTWELHSFPKEVRTKAGQLLLGEALPAHRKHIRTLCNDLFENGVAAIRQEEFSLESWARIGYAPVDPDWTPGGAAPVMGSVQACGQFNQTTLEKLRHAARAIGVEVRHVRQTLDAGDPGSDVNGCHVPGAAHLEIERGMPLEEHGVVLAHELGHALDPNTGLFGADAARIADSEIVADLVAEIVTTALTGAAPTINGHLAGSIIAHQRHNSPRSIEVLYSDALAAAGYVLTATAGAFEAEHVTTTVPAVAGNGEMVNLRAGAAATLADNLPTKVSAATLPMFVAAYNIATGRQLEQQVMALLREQSSSRQR